MFLLKKLLNKKNLLEEEETHWQRNTDAYAI